MGTHMLPYKVHGTLGILDDRSIHGRERAPVRARKLNTGHKNAEYHPRQYLHEHSPAVSSRTQHTWVVPSKAKRIHQPGVRHTPLSPFLLQKFVRNVAITLHQSEHHVCVDAMSLALAAGSAGAKLIFVAAMPGGTATTTRLACTIAPLAPAPPASAAASTSAPLLLLLLLYSTAIVLLPSPLLLIATVWWLVFIAPLGRSAASADGRLPYPSAIRSALEGERSPAQQATAGG